MGVKLWLLAIGVVVSLVCLAIISRHWGCAAPPRPPASWSFAVVSVPNGASIVVKTGLRDRRTATITLADVAAPPDGDQYAEPSRANLERLAGTRIRVEAPRGRLFGADSQSPEADGEQQTELSRTDDTQPPESRCPMIGVVYGESGWCLQLGQLRDGMVRCGPSAPKQYKREEAIAKSEKLGLWKE